MDGGFLMQNKDRKSLGNQPINTSSEKILRQGEKISITLYRPNSSEHCQFYASVETVQYCTTEGIKSAIKR